jgi:hypothetical protein
LKLLGVAVFPGVEVFRVDDAYQLIEWRGHDLVQIPFRVDREARMPG